MINSLAILQGYFILKKSDRLIYNTDAVFTASAIAEEKLYFR
jgi:hypothetical protein